MRGHELSAESWRLALIAARTQRPRSRQSQPPALSTQLWPPGSPHPSAIHLDSLHSSPRHPTLPLSWIVWALVLLVALYVAMGIYLATILKWEDEQTVGLQYYGKPLEERERFKRTLARHASL